MVYGNQVVDMPEKWHFFADTGKKNALYYAIS